MYVRKIKPFKRQIDVDSDKSITHRALILGAAAEGVTKIYSPSPCTDCVSTINALINCGVKIEKKENSIEVFGGITAGNYTPNADNSGTTARLLLGLLSGKNGVNALISGDSSLSKRPMKRIVLPLEKMGARLDFFGSDSEHLPIKIFGTRLNGIEYSLPVPSAQLKSALLLAGLEANGATTLSGEIESRNHTEIMLAAFGANIKTTNQNIDITSHAKYVEGSRKNEEKIILSPSKLRGSKVNVSGDFSSAIYFLVLALLSKDSEIVVRNVNINPSRTAALKLLQDAGADINLSNQKNDIEQSADITAKYSRLKPFDITSENARHMIDELPILATLACFIEGDSTIRGAAELRIKESDRIAAIAEGLAKFGAKIDIFPDGMTIHGEGGLEGGAAVSSRADHRIEMSLAIAAALSRQGGEVESGYAQISFPSFYKIFGGLAN